MDKISHLSEKDLTKILTYAGYILIAFELIKRMVIGPIKSFYSDTTFINGPFKSYEEDVLIRSKHEFDACLLYLQDFMQALDSSDISTIQALRKHRDDLAHNLPDRLDLFEITLNSDLLKKVTGVIFKLSNYRTYMEIGHEPQLKGIDWGSVKGHEYLLFETIMNKVKILTED